VRSHLSLVVVVLVLGCAAAPKVAPSAEGATSDDEVAPGLVVEVPNIDPHPLGEAAVARPILWLAPADLIEGDWAIEERVPNECPFVVHSTGLPAIADDGTVVLPPATIAGHGLEKVKPEVRLQWGQESLVVHVLVERSYDVPLEDALDQAPCSTAYAEAGKRVAELDARLGESKWRSLELVDVAVPGPPGGMDFGIDDLPLAKRPVELLYHGGRLIARVRDVEVLFSQSRPEMRQTVDEFCSADPIPLELWIDRPTNQAVLAYSHNDYGCLCTDEVHYATFTATDELLAAIDSRPPASVAFAELMDADY
jgi:hypothetical protein